MPIEDQLVGLCFDVGGLAVEGEMKRPDDHRGAVMRTGSSRARPGIVVQRDAEPERQVLVGQRVPGHGQPAQPHVTARTHLSFKLTNVSRGEIALRFSVLSDAFAESLIYGTEKGYAYGHVSFYAYLTSTTDRKA